MAEPATNDSSLGSDGDQDFSISAEAMVHEYDDERTIEEEEDVNSGDSFANELDELTQDADIPMEDLLAMYYPGHGSAGESAHEDETDSTGEILITKDLTLDKEQIAQDLLPHESDNSEDGIICEAENVDNIQADHLFAATSRSGSPESPGTQRLLRSNKAADEDSDSGSEDSDYVPPEDWKKTISVGSDYQAVVPEGLCHYDDAPAYENEDRILWDPTKLDDTPVNMYLLQVQSPQSGTQGVKAIPQGAHVRDDERALYILLQCGHNIEEALRRHRMQIAPPMDEMSLWSEEECRNFESGLRMYGKNFHQIHQNKVRTRSVGELVQFYYLWKKTARHDTFANQTRLSKRKYHLHPGITDYMDRFLDEAESMTSPTPAQSLLDRHRLNKPSMLSSLNGTTDLMQNGSPEIGGLITGDLPQEASVSAPSHPHNHMVNHQAVVVSGAIVDPMYTYANSGDVANHQQHSNERVEEGAPPLKKLKLADSKELDQAVFHDLEKLISTDPLLHSQIGSIAGHHRDGGTTPVAATATTVIGHFNTVSASSKSIRAASPASVLAPSCDNNRVLADSVLTTSRTISTTTSSSRQSVATATQ